MDSGSFLINSNLILSELKNALSCVEDASVERFVSDIVGARKIFCTGVGRVLISLEAFVKRLNHLGVEAYIVGSLNEPAITKDDLLVAGSGSGNSVIPVAIAKVARNYDAKIVHIGSYRQGAIAEYVDYMIRIPARTKLNVEDEINSKQIMSSLFEQSVYIFCDSICLMVAGLKGVQLPSLWQHHANLE
jgi:6-phospho-3-hexuloisomerase